MIFVFFDFCKIIGIRDVSASIPDGHLFPPATRHQRKLGGKRITIKKPYSSERLIAKLSENKISKKRAPQNSWKIRTKKQAVQVRKKTLWIVVDQPYRLVDLQSQCSLLNFQLCSAREISWTQPGQRASRCNEQPAATLKTLRERWPAGGNRCTTCDSTTISHDLDGNTGEARWPGVWHGYYSDVLLYPFWTEHNTFSRVISQTFWNYTK